MTEIPAVRSDTFEQVLRERETQVLRTAFRILGNWADAEDVAQEAFLKLHRHQKSLHGDAAVGAWLYRVTVNLCMDRGRSKRPTVEMPELVAPDRSPEAAASGSQQKERLMKALAMLPQRERAAIVLREIEGLSTAEVAEALGSTEGTVRSQIHHAMAKLREFMTREEI